MTIKYIYVSFLNNNNKMCVEKKQWKYKEFYIFF